MARLEVKLGSGCCQEMRLGPPATRQSCGVVGQAEGFPGVKELKGGHGSECQSCLDS